MSKLESSFQSDLIRRLERMIGEKGHVLHVDTSLIQGFPDILIIYKNKWAALECKRGPHEPYQPNQEYYINQLDRWSFASVIFPEIEEQVIHELQQALRIR